VSEAKATVRSNFVEQIDHLVNHRRVRAEASTNEGHADFYMPLYSRANLSLFDIDGITSYFNRGPQEEDFQKVSNESGVQGDYMLIQLQGDFLSVLERAYRSRHQSAVRSRVQAAARMRGHAHDAGVLKNGLQGYVEWLEKQAKDQRSLGDAE
jgi:hypothetical protein